MLFRSIYCFLDSISRSRPIHVNTKLFFVSMALKSLKGGALKKVISFWRSNENSLLAMISSSSFFIPGNQGCLMNMIFSSALKFPLSRSSITSILPALQELILYSLRLRLISALIYPSQKADSVNSTLLACSLFITK